MINDHAKIKNHFNAQGPSDLSGLSVSSTRPSRSAALVIDVQSFEGMTRDDALSFSKALGRQLTEFREGGVPPVWVSIAAGGSKLLPPVADHDACRDLLVLEEMGFKGHLPGSANSDVYAAFINEFGPRDNEVIYRKPSMSALVTRQDRQERDQILRWGGVKFHAQRADGDHPETIYIYEGEQDAQFDKLFPDPLSLHDYLAVQNVTDIYVMGAVSKYCVTETAISASHKGYKTQILSDLTLSWLYDEEAKGQLKWADFDHGALITQALTSAIQDPVRGFSSDQQDKIAKIIVGRCSPKEALEISRVSASNHLQS